MKRVWEVCIDGRRTGLYETDFLAASIRWAKKMFSHEDGSEAVYHLEEV